VNTADTVGSRASVVMEPAPGVRVVREGHIGRLLGSVDARGRMAQLLLVVEDPLQLLQPIEQRSLPLLIGAYVEVEIEGRPIADAVAIPIEALKDGDRVWVVVDGALTLREVEVAWRETEHVLVHGGLAKDDLVVVSPIPTATEGMPATIEAEVDGREGSGPIASASD
jgi:multidrug efflux pump subunit AcrA (membrane-fusion protein)